MPESILARYLRFIKNELHYSKDERAFILSSFKKEISGVEEVD